MNDDIITKECGIKGVPFLKIEDGHAVGRHPDELTAADWEASRHRKRPLLAVMRAKCLDCAHSEAEVRKCASYACDLWPFRMRSNPFQAERSEAQLAASRVAAERLRRGPKKACVDPTV